MSNKFFEIYDGRTNFWQWDTKQKLIVLDKRVTEVRFSNQNMKHSKVRPVYTDNDGVRICNIPDVLLQLPKNLIAYACVEQENGYGSTVNTVKFAVRREQKPVDYTCEQEDIIEGILMKLGMLEALRREVKAGTKEFIKFENESAADAWIVDNGQSGDIILILSDAGWIPYMIEDDNARSPICDCDGNMIIIDPIDDDNDSSEEIDPDEVKFQIWDGGDAFGVYFQRFL